MTVGDLIDELSKHDRNAKVFQTERYDYGQPVDLDEVMSCRSATRKVVHTPGIPGCSAWPTNNTTGVVEKVVILDYLNPLKGDNTPT